MRILTEVLTIRLSRLNAAEYLNLMGRLRTLVEAATPEAIGLTDGEFEEFSILVNQLTDRINYNPASDQTPLLDTLDDQRDSLLTFLFSTVNNGAKLPIEPQGEAGRELRRITGPFTSVQGGQDQQETVRVKSLLDALETPEARTFLATLNLTATVGKLREINERYEEISADRARNKEAERMNSAPTTVLRERMDPLFRAIRLIAQSKNIIDPSPATAEFVLGLNSAIREVSALYNLRSARRKPKE